MSAHDAPVIPGFYFDKIKNRYFKLLPGQTHINPLSGESLVKRKVPKRCAPSIYQSRQQKFSKNVCFNISCLLWQRQLLAKYSKKAVLETENSILFNLIKARACGEIVSCRLDSSSSNIQLCKPSADCNKMLICTNKLKLWSVEKLKYRKGKLNICEDTSFVVCDLPFSSVNDLCFASVRYTNSGVVSACVPQMACGTELRLIPDVRRKTEMFRKRVKHFTRVCLWKENRLIYSADAKALIIKDIESHFARNSAWNSGSASTFKNRINANNHVISLDYKHSLLFAGHLRGGFFVYDEREEGKSCLSVHQEEDTSCIRVLEDDRRVLLKCRSSSVDGLYLWDIRFPANPVLQYETVYTNNDSPQVLGRSFFVDVAEQVISCDNHEEGTVNLWNLRNGENLQKDIKVCKGMYSSHWPIFNNQSGVLGHTDSLLWVSL